MTRIDARAIWQGWKLALSAGVDLFAPGVSEKLPVAAGWLALRLPTEGLGSLPAITVVDAMRALDLERRATPPDAAQAELVMTTPRLSVESVVTRDAVRSLIRGAERELLVVGFSIRDPEFRSLLVERGCRGVRVTVVGDRAVGDARDLWRSWPPAAGELRAFEDAETGDGIARRVHAKALVRDRTSVLLGSANFSVSGMSTNIEIGVLCHGAVARRVADAVDELSRAGWIARIT